MTTNNLTLTLSEESLTVFLDNYFAHTHSEHNPSDNIHNPSNVVLTQLQQEVIELRSRIITLEERITNESTTTSNINTQNAKPTKTTRNKTVSNSTPDSNQTNNTIDSFIDNLIETATHKMNNPSTVFNQSTVFTSDNDNDSNNDNHTLNSTTREQLDSIYTNTVLNPEQVTRTSPISSHTVPNHTQVTPNHSSTITQATANNTPSIPTVSIPAVLPSTIKTFANQTLDTLIHYELSGGSTHSTGSTYQQYDYIYFIQNREMLHISKEKLNKIVALIAEYNTELTTLLEQHCDNSDMVNQFLLAGTVINLQNYLTLRYKNEFNEDIVPKIQSLSLSQLCAIISRLPKYIVTKEFVINVSNLKAPQMAIKSALTKNYNHIVTRATGSFSTF